ncbi:unnamed protein product [Candida verbasci]|uniref:Arrestin C-terminal-like domain-containing protein n=1 Tax=Candida verbasci TaxID=1227364 RepID=A0A9W4TWD8_9ASCO|nr:unnamed protein product [Candida verbasci]
MKHISLFDVKLKSQHKNTLLIKGNEFEIENIPFEGSVKLSLNEDIDIKKITLSLIGEFSYEYSHKITHEQFLDRLCVLKIDWNNLLCSDQGNITLGNYGDPIIPMYKLKKKNVSGTSTPTERPHNYRTKSTPLFKDKETCKILIPKSGIDGTPFKNLDQSTNHSFLLPKGNYSLPFKVYLPSNIGETIEGLPIGTLLYKLQCNIERGRFEKKISVNKHIRVVRTLHPQNLNLTDSIDVDNTWVGKLQYKVSMLKKGVAIGSNIPINIIIIPIAKGLSLKAMNACIVEHYHIDVNGERSPEYERLIGKQELSIPDEDLPYDRWDIKTQYKVPDQLKKITQTCDVRSMIVVKHRLRVAIQLRNKEGHVSELRANLPIYVYISANSGHVIGRHYEVDNHHGTFILDMTKEDLVFKRHDEEEEEEESDLDREDSAPPLYSKHIFDRIYDMNLPQTPLEQFRSQVGSPVYSNNSSSLNVAGYFELPIDKALEENMKKHKARSSNVDYLHIPSYNEALDADEDEESFTQDDFAPCYSGSDSSSLSSTNPIKINKPKNNNTGHFKFHLKSSSLPHSRSNSAMNIDRLPDSVSPKPKKFFSKK